MDPVHREILRKHRIDLSNQILVGDIIVQYLYQENILTASHVEEIESQVSNKRKTLRLLDILPTRGPLAFDVFMRALEEEFSWVRDVILRDLQSYHPAEKGSADDWPVPSDILRRVPSDRELSRLASRLGPEWECVLLDLGLSSGALHRCRADHANSLHGQVLAGLVQWRQSQGRDATVQRLLESLRAADVHLSVLDEVFS